MGDKRKGVGDEQLAEGHRPLLELATRQHGVVSTRQLALLGYTRSSASKAHGVGRIRRIYRGVYMVGHEDLNWTGRCMAAVLACEPAVASHMSAAWLWGLFRSRPERIQITCSTQRRPRQEFAIYRSAIALTDLSVVDGIPVTSVARTKLDLAAMLRPGPFEGVLERSEELGLFDLTAVEHARRRYPHHPGARPLREALSIYREDLAVTRSRLEKRFLVHVREGGLTVPAMNFGVPGFELDAYWERERFAVELDVFETHGTQVAFERDRIRADDLLAIGIEMIRITGPRLRREPEAVIRRLGEHLARRRRELA